MVVNPGVDDRRQAHEKRQKEILEAWEDMTERAGEVQQQVLHHILSRNASCDYLRRLGLDGRTDADSFRASVPLIAYEDVEADIRRLKDGDPAPILTVDPPVEFLASSGTSGGVRKLFPTVAGDAERRAWAASLLRPVLTRHVPGLDQGKCLYFLFSRQAETLPGSGLLCLPVVSSLYRSPAFRNRAYDPSWVLTSPDAVLLSTADNAQSMYCHLLLGLAQAREVLSVGAIMASTLVHALRLLEQVWRELCADIAGGSVSRERVTEPALREACAAVLAAPDPALAAAIGAACEELEGRGSWAGVVPRLWPNVKLMDAVTTGAMEAYVPVLEAYAGGGVRVVSGQLYASSECYLGVNMRPLDAPQSASYTLIPSNAYYEFVPVSHGSEVKEEENATVGLVDVEVGREYELAITNYAGLYRYRMGDVLRCTGRYNQAPHFFFVGRASATLSVDCDKTSEREVQFAVTKAARHLHQAGMRLRDYSSYCDMASSPGHYVVFLEVEGGLVEAVPEALLEECCATMESSFNYVYCVCRREKAVGPLELRVVRRGAFDDLAALAIARGASMAQYKPPRCLKQQEMVDLLTSRVSQSYHSAGMPKFDVSNFEAGAKAS